MLILSAGRRTSPLLPWWGGDYGSRAGSASESRCLRVVSALHPALRNPRGARLAVMVTVVGMLRAAGVIASCRGREPWHTGSVHRNPLASPRDSLPQKPASQGARGEIHHTVLPLSVRISSSKVLAPWHPGLHEADPLAPALWVVEKRDAIHGRGNLSPLVLIVTRSRAGAALPRCANLLSSLPR